MAPSLGQIVAIDAQDALVLRQELRREHLGSVVLFCTMTDALLALADVLGMAQALGERPSLARFLTLADAAFLLLYSMQVPRRVRYPNQLRAAAGGDGLGQRAVLAQAVVFTLFNPHVYLDTVPLVDSIGAQQASALHGWLVMGAGSANLFWFVSLGFGACWLTPWSVWPKAWQISDGLIGTTMLVLPALLLCYVLRGL